MDAIGVIRNTEKAGTGEIAEKIRLYLKRKGTDCHISADGSDLPPSCSKAVVLGGDGTLLRAAKVVLKQQLPLLWPRSIRRAWSRLLTGCLREPIPSSGG